MSRNSAIVATLFLASSVILTKPDLVVAQKNKLSSAINKIAKRLSKGQAPSQ